MGIKDIAIKTGVATSTVSRVLNGDVKCAREEVRQRIFNAAKELNYVPNLAAKDLKKGVSNSYFKIHILHARSNRKDDSYFSALAIKVKEEVLKSGNNIGEEYYGVKTEEFTKNEGMVVLGRPTLAQESFIRGFNGRVINITLNSVVEDCDQIICDGKEAARCALDYLYHCGHKRIAYVGEFLDEVRYIAYKEFLIEHKMQISQSLAINVHMSREGGEKAAKQIYDMEERPTAIFCGNDLTAIGVMNGLSELGVKIPNDISIVGIDNILEAEEIEPPLTTVDVSLDELAHMGVMTLIDKLKNGHDRIVKTYLPVELIKRASVKKMR